MYNNIYISWWVYFVTGLNLVLQQPLTAALAKTKTDIVKKSSCLTPINQIIRRFHTEFKASLCWTKQQQCDANLVEAGEGASPNRSLISFQVHCIFRILFTDLHNCQQPMQMEQNFQSFSSTSGHLNLNPHKIILFWF